MSSITTIKTIVTDTIVNDHVFTKVISAHRPDDSIVIDNPVEADQLHVHDCLRVGNKLLVENELESSHVVSDHITVNEINVSKNASFQGTITVKNDLSIKRHLHASDADFVDVNTGSLVVSKDTKLKNANVTGRLKVNELEAANFTLNQIKIADHATLNHAHITGKLSAESVNFNNLMLNNLIVKEDTGMNNLKVVGTLETNNLSFDELNLKRLIVKQQAGMNHLKVVGSFQATGASIDELTLNDLQVQHNATFDNDVTINGKLQVDSMTFGSSTVENLTVNDTLNVKHVEGATNITVENMSVTNDLEIAGLQFSDLVDQQDVVLNHIDQLNNDVDELNTNMVQINQLLDDLVASVQNNDERVDLLENDVQNWQDNINQQIQNFQQQFNNVQNQVNQITDSITNLNTEIFNLQTNVNNELSTVSNQVNNLTSLVNTFETSISALQDKSTQLEQSVNNINTQMNNLNDLVDDLVDFVVSFETRVTNVESATNSLESSIDNINSIVGTLQHNINDVLSEFSQVQTNIDNLDNQFNDLQSQLDNYTISAAKNTMVTFGSDDPVNPELKTPGPMTLMPTVGVINALAFAAHATMPADGPPLKFWLPQNQSVPAWANDGPVALLKNVSCDLLLFYDVAPANINPSSKPQPAANIPFSLLQNYASMEIECCGSGGAGALGGFMGVGSGGGGSGYTRRRSIRVEELFASFNKPATVRYATRKAVPTLEPFSVMSDVSYSVNVPNQLSVFVGRGFNLSMLPDNEATDLRSSYVTVSHATFTPPGNVPLFELTSKTYNAFNWGELVRAGHGSTTTTRNGGNGEYGGGGGAVNSQANNTNASSPGTSVTYTTPNAGTFDAGATAGGFVGNSDNSNSGNFVGRVLGGRGAGNPFSQSVGCFCGSGGGPFGGLAPVFVRSSNGQNNIYGYGCMNEIILGSNTLGQGPGSETFEHLQYTIRHHCENFSQFQADRILMRGRFGGGGAGGTRGGLGDVTSATSRPIINLNCGGVGGDGYVIIKLYKKTQ